MRSNATGIGSYYSEYRSFNRGFGRGHPRPYQSSQRQSSSQPTRKGDLFIEAGRLAVEYLVSNGLLSSNVLSGKCQNGTFRSSSGEFRGHGGSHDREIISNSRVADRSTGTSCQGAASPDGVSGARKTPDDEDPRMSGNYSGEKRRLGVSRSYGHDWNRENEGEESFSNRVTASQGMDAENDKFLEGKSKDADADDYNSNLKDSASKDERYSELQGEMGKSHHVDSDLKMTSSLQSKDEKALSEPSDVVNTGCKETEDGTRDSDVDIETSKHEWTNQDCEEKNDTSSKSGVDLLKLCPSAKIPTKIRSSLMNKSLKNDPPLISEEEKDSGYDSIVSIKDDTMNRASGVLSSNEVPSSDSVCNHSRDGGDLRATYAGSQSLSLESVACTEKTLSSEQKSDGLPEIERPSSITDDRCGKRAFGEGNMGEGAKKAKKWLSIAQSDDYSQLSDLSEKQSISLAKGVTSASILSECSNHESFTNMSSPLKCGVESAKEQGEEKQLFSNSFKICDLNLMEASDVRDNRDMPVLMYPSISAASKGSLADIDLSMNNNCGLTSSYNDCGAVRKDIEIIDLEGGTFKEGESMNASASNAEAGIMNVGSFQNSSHNSNHNPDGQDGYGFMISELLGNDVPNCSSVQPDMNSLQNEMGVHHGEGIFAEDDPIYMSFGDIPLSLLRVWDQQTQERNPFEM